MEPPIPLKTAVLIDHRPNHPGEIGGLAGTWERIAREAGGRPDLALTLFFLGDTRGIIEVAENVRYVLLRPLLGTERFPFFGGIPTHTDLAPAHPRLFRYLSGFHVLHTTDSFRAYAKTALWRSRLTGTPLVSSVQTDVIGWAGIHTPRILERIIPSRRFRVWLLEDFRYLEKQEKSMERRLGRYMRRCRAVFVSHRRDCERLARLAPSTPRYRLRRGIDLDLFSPERRDRARLEETFCIPPHKTILLFVGRIDPVKGALIAAQTARNLLEKRYPVHLLVVGDGSQRDEVQRAVGDGCTMTGNLPHHDLGWIYASADLLLFPSEAEVWPNVVMEARACGLPVIACRCGAEHVMRGGGVDGILASDRNPEAWTALVESLLSRPERLRQMRARSRGAVLKQAPSWRQVLDEDLMPVWREVASAPRSRGQR